MKPDDQLIAEVRELDAKATPEPWVSKINHAPYKCVWFDPEDNYTTLELKAEDADFIAAARDLLPDLANRLEAANAEVERLRKESEWRDISEAPRDGTRIVGWNQEYGQRETYMQHYREGSPGFAAFQRNEGPSEVGWAWIEPKNNWASTWKPTHFRALPTPPKQAKDA